MKRIPSLGDPSVRTPGVTTSSMPENLFVLWEKPYILKIVRVIRLPTLYGTGIASYITSHHVLDDIIQPA